MKKLQLRAEHSELPAIHLTEKKTNGMFDEASSLNPVARSEQYQKSPSTKRIC